METKCDICGKKKKNIIKKFVRMKKGGYRFVYICKECNERYLNAVLIAYNNFFKDLNDADVPICEIFQERKDLKTTNV